MRFEFRFVVLILPFLCPFLFSAYNKVLGDRMTALEEVLANKDEQGVIDSYLLKQNKELQEQVVILTTTMNV